MLETLMYPTNTQGGENLAVETISRKEAIAWLAGIIDGEGCIAAYWQIKGKDMAGPGFRVVVHMSGTNPLLIARITEVLVSLGIGFNLAARKRPNGASERASMDVVVAGKGRVAKLLNIVIKHLTEKRCQAEIMLQLIAYRESLAKTGQIKGVVGSKPLNLFQDPTILGLIESLKEAKRDFPSVLDFSRRPGEVFGSQSSETIRHQLRVGEVMIESDLHGDMQSAAEMTASAL